MGRKRLLGLSALAGAAFAGSAASGAVILNSSSGPNATYGGTYNFSTLGTFDYVYFPSGAEGAGTTSTTGDEKTGNTLFSPLTIVYGGNGGGTEYFNHGGYTAAEGATITNNGDGTSPATITSSAGNVYVRNGAVDDGSTFTYSMPADSSQTLTLFLENYDALSELSLSSSSSGSLFSQSSGVGLPSSDGTNGAGSGHGAADYTFSLTNTSASTDTLTFTYIESATNGGSSSVGLQGVTVSNNVPEPASITVLAMASLGLLLPRRRATRSV